MSQRACELLADARVAAYVGRGLLYPTACDGALKLLEVAYTPALAFAPEEFRHGPVAVADEDFVLVVLASGPHEPAVARVTEEVGLAGGAVIAVGDDERVTAAAQIAPPDIEQLVVPFLYMPALQLLALGRGIMLDRPVDSPRGLHKVVSAV